MSELDNLKADNERLRAALRWIDRRCPELVVRQLDEPTRLHVEMAHDAGACARSALAGDIGGRK